jgi:hypothetical protein
MPPIILYIIKLSVTLAILWLFYCAVLRRLTFYTWNRWYLFGYAAISLLTRTLIRWASLALVRKQATLITDNGIRIYQVARKIKPFSFGNAIYINPRLHTEKEWQEIILHEYVHIRQRHTIDILLAELITILNWYNPFAWALRHSIRQNLEFIADQKVLDNGVDKKATNTTC